MNPSELIELRRLAENTTPGRWELFNGYLIRACNESVCTPIAELNPPYRFRVGIVRGEKEQWANGEFMAAANPQAILALLNDRDRLAQRVAELERRLELSLHDNTVLARNNMKLREAEARAVQARSDAIEECAQLMEKQHAWISNIASARVIRAALLATPPHGKDAQGGV